MLIGYARTSTVEQVAGFEDQKRELEKAGVDRVYSEQVSAVAQSRPQFDLVMAIPACSTVEVRAYPISIVSTPSCLLLSRRWVRRQRLSTQRPRYLCRLGHHRQPANSRANCQPILAQSEPALS